MIRQALRDIYAIIRINVQFHWYCTIRHRLDLFLPIWEQEGRDIRDQHGVK
jgi:hypothetical protein